MARHFRIEELLGRDEYESLREFAREPARTIDEVWEWMTAKGLTISRSACGNWVREFRLSDRYDAGNQAAQAVVERMKANGGVVAINEANNVQLATAIFESLNDLMARGDATPKEILALAMATRRSMDVNLQIQEAKRQVLDQMSEKARQSPDGKVSQSDIDDARKRIFG